MEQIRNARKHKGWSQEQLAAAVGLKRSVISKYESGVISPSVDTLENIATALGVSVNYLLGKDGEIVNVSSYKDGAITGVRIRPKDGEEYVELEFDTKKLSLFELNALIEVFTRVSEKYGMSIDALAHLAEASANAIASLPRAEAEKAQYEKDMLHRLTEDILAKKDSGEARQDAPQPLQRARIPRNRAPLQNRLKMAFATSCNGTANHRTGSDCQCVQLGHIHSDAEMCPTWTQKNAAPKATA